MKLKKHRTSRPRKITKTKGEIPEHSKVQNRRQCRRGRSACAASTRAHPAAATRWTRVQLQAKANSPRPSSSSSSTGTFDPHLCQNRAKTVSEKDERKRLAKLNKSQLIHEVQKFLVQHHNNGGKFNELLLYLDNHDNPQTSAAGNKNAEPSGEDALGQDWPKKFEMNMGIGRSTGHVPQTKNLMLC